jgi:hypothetical protein
MLHDADLEGGWTTWPFCKNIGQMSPGRARSWTRKASKTWRRQGRALQSGTSSAPRAASTPRSPRQPARMLPSRTPCATTARRLRAGLEHLRCIDPSSSVNSALAPTELPLPLTSSRLLHLSNSPATASSDQSIGALAVADAQAISRASGAPRAITFLRSTQTVSETPARRSGAAEAFGPYPREIALLRSHRAGHARGPGRMQQNRRARRPAVRRTPSKTREPLASHHEAARRPQPQLLESTPACSRSQHRGLPPDYVNPGTASSRHRALRSVRVDGGRRRIVVPRPTAVPLVNAAPRSRARRPSSLSAPASRLKPSFRHGLAPGDGAGPCHRHRADTSAPASSSPKAGPGYRASGSRARSGRDRPRSGSRSKSRMARGGGLTPSRWKSCGSLARWAKRKKALALRLWPPPLKVARAVVGDADVL